MSKKYCFRITKLDGNDFDMDELKNFIREIYIDRAQELKDKLMTVYITVENSVCIQLVGSSAKANEKIKEITAKLTESDLTWNNISLEPYEFDDKPAISFGGKEGVKWESLVHNGPYFTEIMEPYVPLGASLRNKTTNKVYILRPNEEKIAGFYAERIITDETSSVCYTKPNVNEKPNQKNARDTFNKNFWNDFQNYLGTEAKRIFKSIDDIDWTDLVEKIKANTQDKKSITPIEKQKAKEKSIEIDGKYGYATVNGIRLQKIGNFKMEASGIFIGRGDSGRLGRIKKPIRPKDVTINCGETDKVPDPPEGHTWAHPIIHDYSHVWLASWRDSVTGDLKYIYLSGKSAFKADSDLIKYEKARKLHSQIDTIRFTYMRDASGSNSTKKQLGTVLYLIDFFGIRVGNPKEEDEAETVGATTILVKNVIFKPPSSLQFNFLGKDSIEYNQVHYVPSIIYENFTKLTDGKDPEDKIFDISSGSINRYLDQFDKSFTAKVFRTRLASEIMYNALHHLIIPATLKSKTAIKSEFNKANIKVAEALNHTRTPNQKTKESILKMKSKLEEATDEKTINRLSKSISAKENVLSVAINTSLTNYIDPRLVVSWAKKQNVDPGAIYTGLLFQKFERIINSTDEDWDWGDLEKSPLQEEEQEEEPSSITPKRPPGSEPSTSGVSNRPPRSEPSTSGVSKRPPRSEPSTSGVSTRPPLRSEPSTSGVSTRPPPRSEPSTSGVSIRPPPRSEASTSGVSTRSPPSGVSKRPPVRYSSSFKIENSVIDPKSGPGDSEDYELLFKICKNLKKYKSLISDVNMEVLEWLYPFCKKSIEGGNKIDATKFIVEYVESQRLSQSPNKIVSTAVDNKKAPKEKIKEDAPLIIPPENKRFVYLNLLRSKKDIKEYCHKHTISTEKLYTKNQLKEAIMEYFKDVKKYPWPPIF